MEILLIWLLWTGLVAFWAAHWGQSVILNIFLSLILSPLISMIIVLIIGRKRHIPVYCEHCRRQLTAELDARDRQMRLEFDNRDDINPRHPRLIQ